MFLHIIDVSLESLYISLLIFLVYYCLFIYHVIIIALFMSIMNVLITLSHWITQLTVVHLYVVEIIIVLLIDRTNIQNF